MGSETQEFAYGSRLTSVPSESVPENTGRLGRMRERAKSDLKMGPAPQCHAEASGAGPHDIGIHCARGSKRGGNEGELGRSDLIGPMRLFPFFLLFLFIFCFLFFLFLDFKVEFKFC